MPAERQGPEESLLERLAEASGEELMKSFTYKMVSDPTAGDPRLRASYRRPPTPRVGDRLTDSFPDATPELIMDTIAKAIPTMSPKDFSNVTTGITVIGHVFPDMLAPAYVRGITEISIAIGTRRAVDKMSAKLDELRIPPSKG